MATKRAQHVYGKALTSGGRLLCLIALLLLGCLPFSIHADALLDIDGSKDKLVRPEIDQTEFDRAAIDSERFEIVAYTGFYAFENFDSRPMFGAKGSYHFKNRFFLDVDYATTSVKGSIVAGSTINNIDESATLLDASLGFNLIEGQVFLRDGFALTNELYIKYGQGRVEINQAENDYSTWGMGVRLLHPNDLLSFQTGFTQDSIDPGNGLDNNKNLKFFAGVGIYF